MARLLTRGGVAAGQRVLVTGAGGGVGSYVVQIAKAAGAHVTGLVAPERMDAVLAPARLLERAPPSALVSKSSMVISGRPCGSNTR